MFNSIQQFETAGIKNLRKAEDEFIRTRGMANFINAIKEVVLHLGLDVIAETLENYDAAIRKSPKRSEKWSVVRKDPKQLVTSLGTVQYRKTLFINKTTKERSYLLDRELGLEKHQRITEDAEAQLLTEAVQTTYRKGGEAVPHPASTKASRQTGQPCKHPFHGSYLPCISRRKPLPDCAFIFRIWRVLPFRDSGILPPVQTGSSHGSVRRWCR